MTRSLRVQTGLDVLLAGRCRRLRGSRVGLLTHAAAVDRRLRPAPDCLADAGVRLTALYGPEHGVRGDAQAGETVAKSLDARLDIPVYSLYGQETHLSTADHDGRMRDFDTRRQGKVLTPEMTAGIDLLLCDLQDVGTRVYTYIATLVYALETCAETGLPLIVLDRPNPLGGVVMEGPLLEYPAFASPVGALPIPLRHGLTIGEAANFANETLFSGRAKLTVMPLKGWRRTMRFVDTGLPWVLPSPNMPTPDTAAVYPGQVLFEGANVSEGRGSTRPFELVGAPWLDGPRLAARLNELRLPGVAFRPAWFTPAFSKFAGTPCSGVQLHVGDGRRYRPFATALHAIAQIRELHPGEFRFHDDYFDKMLGTSRVRTALLSGEAVPAILASLQPGLRRFGRQRRRFLLYR